jgi:hypothetical protein
MNDSNSDTSNSTATSDNSATKNQPTENSQVKETLNGMVNVLQFLTKVLPDGEVKTAKEELLSQAEIAGLWHLLHGVKEAAENCYALYCEETRKRGNEK